MADLNTNLTRLANARDDIAEAIVAKGGTVGEYDGFEDFATDIGTISGGCDGVSATISLDTRYGTDSTITVYNKNDVTETYTKDVDSNGKATFTGLSTGAYASYATLATGVKSGESNFTVSNINDNVNYFAWINLKAFTGVSTYRYSTFTLTNGTTTITTEGGVNGVSVYVSLGTWRITATYNNMSGSTSKSISSYIGYDVSIKMS